jgi:hypothetical protein
MRALILTAALWNAPQVAAAGELLQWTPPVNFSEQPDLISTFPVLLCDAAQNTHALWVERTDRDAYLFYRTDAEGAWSAPRDTLAQPSINYLRADIGPDSYVYALWTTNLLSGDLMMSRAPLSAAGDPRQWERPWPLASGARAGDLFIDAGGALRVLYGQTDESAMSHDLMLMTSTDGGKRWSAPEPVASFVTPVSATLNGSIVVDAKGRGHITWGLRSYEYGAYSRLGYLRADEGLLRWGEPVELAAAVTAPGVDVPRVFAFGPDEIHVTWSEPARRHIRSVDGGRTWSPPVTIVELGAAFGGFNQLAQDEGNALHAITAVGDGLYYSRDTGNGWGPAEPLDRRPFDPHGQQLVLCQGNRLHVAYYDRTGENEIWYASRMIDAPARERRPVPTAMTVAQPSPSALRHANAQKTSATPPGAASQPAAAVVTTAPVAARASPFAPALAGAAASAAVILLVVAAARARQNRRGPR